MRRKRWRNSCTCTAAGRWLRPQRLKKRPCRSGQHGSARSATRWSTSAIHSAPARRSAMAVPVVAGRRRSWAVTRSSTLSLSTKQRRKRRDARSWVPAAALRYTKPWPCDAQLHSASRTGTWHQLQLMPRASKGQVASGRSGERSEHPVPNDAGAIKVAPDPAHDLQGELAYGVLSQFLIENHIHTGYGPAVWSEDFMLKFCPWQALFHEAYAAHRLAGALAADIGELDCSACRT